MITLAIISLPMLVALVLFFNKNRQIAKNTAFAASVATLGLTLVAWNQYSKHLIDNLNFSYSWIPSMGVSFSGAVDGLSLALLLLTAMLIPLIILSSYKTEHSPSMYPLILMMQSALAGVFTVTDGLVFYIFWELALIPIYFICALWGGENRIKVTLKFFIYTLFGSLLLLVGLIYLYINTPGNHSFDYGSLKAVDICPCKQQYVFLAMFIAFAIKIPVFPLHTWQPDTYVTAPTTGSMLLAGVMLKMGIYGILRWLLPLNPKIAATYGIVIVILGVVSLLYGSVIAIMQKEVKRLVAYSSLAHVGLMTAAAFVFNVDAYRGVVIQMISHGVVVVGLFFVADIISRRTGTLEISSLGGIAKVAPRFAIFFMIVMLASVALPLTSGFVGEFLMLAGLYQFSPWIAGIAGISIILGAVYMFWLYQRTMYGQPNEKTSNFEDIKGVELVVAVVLILLILWLGIYPKPILSFIL